MERPLGPGVRKKGRNTYQVSVENYKKDKEKLGPEKFEKLKKESQKQKFFTGGQAKIAAKAPPRNKIDAKDFAVLRAEKAKGRGMGLQDEKVQPGKVMKARVGKSVQGTTAASANKNTFRGYQKVFETGADRSTPKAQRGVSTIVGVKPNSAIGRRKKKRVTYKSMDEMRQKTLGYKKGESTEAFKARKANENFAKQAAKATGPRGKAALAVAAAGVTAYQYLKSKMTSKEDRNKKMLRDYREQKKPGIPSQKTKDINKALNRLDSKKMGGGMMQKPMGYSTGMGPETNRQAGDRSAGPATRSQRKKRLDKKLNAVGLGAMSGRQASRLKDAIDQEKRYRSSRDAVEENLNAAISKRRRTGKMPFNDRKSAKKFFNELEASSTRESAARMMSGGMTKPMGYKSGKSIKVKCKLGKNKPTKMY